MNLSIEMASNQVVCRQNGTQTFAAPLTTFLTALGERMDAYALPEAIPDGVRFIRRRGETVVLALEEKPQVRTVKWLADESPVPFGKGAIYRNARLAFPFIIVVLAFRNGALTGQQQCFYRTAPLTSPGDTLLLPNLYNVAEAYGQRCWLCLGQLRADLMGLSWNDRVLEIRAQFWGGPFNQSAEVHEGTSFWTTMRDLDARLASVTSWERATTHDAFFPLQVAWKPSGLTIGQVIEQMLALGGPPVPTTVAHVAQLLGVVAAQGGRPADKPW
jgi:hypothetical protein